MGIIMRNNVAYSGNGGSETVELSMAEYEAREATGAIDSDTWYLIYDATDSYNAKKVVYDNAESGMTARTVQGAIDELNSNIDDQNKNLSVRYNAETDMIQILADNGNWYDFQKAYIYDTPLYSYGNEYADITGGWSNIANRAVNFTKNADNMYSNNHATSVGGIGTSKIIDLTTFKTIKVKANVTGIYAPEKLGLKVRLLNSDKSTAKEFSMNETGLRDWSFDISSYNGKYYIEIYKPSANECRGYIYEVQLGR